jgi:hypothetical protein|tara:strand:+ start:458 stop:1432 length:975 start_codon:yes stop_codon:yes gene_type:complete
MPRTYETPTPADSETIREEQSGVVIQLKNSPEAIKRLGKNKNENTHYERERDHLRSEMGFQKHRSFAASQAMTRILGLELQAIEEFPIERILAATDPKENQLLYEETCRIENSYINQLITLDYEPEAKFEDQRGLARLNLIKFFLSKTELCYSIGIKLNKNNLDAHILTDTELRLNDISKQIRQLFNEAREIGQNDPEKFKEFSDGISSITTEKNNQVQLPEKAPELYKERRDRKEKPDVFIRRVYEPWLGEGLLRPHIKDFDEPLYRALYKHGIPEDFKTLLPTAQGRAVEHLSRTDAEMVQAIRETRRRADQKRREISQLAR